MSINHSTEKRCTFDGCDKTQKSKGLCAAHYWQLSKKKTLSPLYSTQRMPGTPPQIDYREVPCLVPGLIGPCHEWIRGKDNGYGIVGINGKKIYVHRYVWELANGQIPDGLVVDHQCRNKTCCNVDHLRVVTHKVNSTENVVDMNWQIQKSKTHCKYGHEFTKENTYIRNKKGNRTCRSCLKQRMKKYRLSHLGLDCYGIDRERRYRDEGAGSKD